MSGITWLIIMAIFWSMLAQTDTNVQSGWPVNNKQEWKRTVQYLVSSLELVYGTIRVWDPRMETVKTVEFLLISCLVKFHRKALMDAHVTVETGFTIREALFSPVWMWSLLASSSWLSRWQFVLFLWELWAHLWDYTYHSYFYSLWSDTRNTW